jgi:hypothetical protein
MWANNYEKSPVREQNTFKPELKTRFSSEIAEQGRRGSLISEVFRQLP